MWIDIKYKNNLNKDIDGNLVLPLSVVEVEIDTKTSVISLVDFNNFMCKNK